MTSTESLTLEKFQAMTTAAWARHRDRGNEFWIYPLGCLAFDLGLSDAETVTDRGTEATDALCDYLSPVMSTTALWAFEYGTWLSDKAHCANGGDACCGDSNLMWARLNNSENWYRAGAQFRPAINAKVREQQ